jgi:hypothetical protein
MRDSSHRIARYNARMLSTQLDPVGVAVNDKAMTNYATYVDEFYPLQVKLRNILDSAGLSNLLFASFEAFNGECYHLYKVCSGPALVANLTTLVLKWKDAAYLGAGNASVLKAICLQLYACTIP